MVYCKKCGEQLSGNQTFCTKCGTPVSVDAKTETVLERIEKDTNLQDYWIKRLIAYIIDSIILGVVTGILIAVVMFPFFIRNPFGFFNLFSFPFASGLVSVIYFTLMESSRGSSFGKSLLNLKVSTKEGRNISLEKAFIRNITKIYPVLLLVDIIGGLVTTTDLHQKYTDKIANTIVE